MANVVDLTANDMAEPSAPETIDLCSLSSIGSSDSDLNRLFDKSVPAALSMRTAIFTTINTISKHCLIGSYSICGVCVFSNVSILFAE